MKPHRRNQENRVRKAHRLDVEMGEEVPESRIREHWTRDSKMDLQNPRLAHSLEPLRCLRLDRQRPPEIPAKMDLEVPSIIVSHRPAPHDSAVRREGCHLAQSRFC